MARNPGPLRQIKDLAGQFAMDTANPAEASMFTRLRSYMKRQQDMAEINALTERDLNDLALTREQLRTFVSMPVDVSERVQAMAAIFGLSGPQVKRDRGLWLDLQACCGTCNERKNCTEVLERGELSRPRDAGFCPNAADFTQLAEKAA